MQTPASSSDTNQVSENEPTFVLTSVAMNIINPTQAHPQKISFYARVCVESRCCETGTLRKRSGIFTFSEDFQNLGNCQYLRRNKHETVTVTPQKVEQTDLQIMTIKVEFENFLFIAENSVSSFWGRIPAPLQWGVLRDMAESNESVGNRNPLPDVQCPMSSTNACPRNNVRVHARLPDAPKSCYYQR